MSKPFTYWVRLAMVATMCTLVTFSPVSAGRWMDRLLHRDACKVVPDCCDPKVTCEPVVSCEPCCLVVPAASCAQAAPTLCDSVPVEPGVTASPKVITPSPVIEKPSPVVEKPAPVVEKPAPVVDKPAPIVDKPAPVVDKPAPVVEKPADANPFSEPAVKEPMPVPAAENDPFGAEPEVTNPAEPDMPAEPTAKSDLDDLFGDKPAATEPEMPKDIQPTDLFDSDPKPSVLEPEVPGEAKATEPGLDDLFGSEPKPTALESDAPVEAKPADASIDDLFGSEPKPTSPASDVPVEAKPADTAIDDLFGSEPKTDTPAPAKTDTPDPGLDDLFGSEPKPASKDVPAKPTTEPSIDDLFDDKPAAPATPTPADTSIEDLFGKPITTEAQPAPSAAASSDDSFIDSLFGKSTTPPDTNTAKPAPIEPSLDKPAAKETKDAADELDALFGLGANTRSSDFNGAEFRQWVDNSGAYQVKARLTVIYSDKVKLMKENGKFTTVSLSRLSEADFGYVTWVASSMTKGTTARMVKTEIEPVESDVAR